MATSVLTTKAFGLDIATGGSPSEPKPPEPKAAASTDERANIAVPFVALAVVAGAWWLIKENIADGTYDATEAPAAPVEGLTIFAVFFVASAGLERLLEPFGALWGKTKASATDAVQAVATAIATYKEALAVWQEANDDVAKSAAKEATDAAADDVNVKLQEAAQATAAAAAVSGRKAAVVWGLATILGMLASASLKLYLLKQVGIAAPPRELEILATGLIIGAGTKPLHDLVALIEKKKEAASTSPT